jgi:alkanesulfonate monooxygenase SsuD/methylene tetrahydromethanopterin reductase-like flavin-dependent oxidoreductase (luciferase family)
MPHPFRIGLKLAQDAPIEAYRRVWTIADETGFDHVWAFDHLATIGGHDDGAVFDGWTLLGAMAVATKRPRIGLLVTGVTYRNPALLAKLAVTVDHLSGGRLEFGIGAAWAANEHEMYGIEGLDRRVGRLSEALHVMKMLWTQPHSDFNGRYYQLRNAVAEPKPVQKPHPPIWIGASGPTVLKLTARHADVWNVAGEAGRSLEKAVETAKMLDEACAAIGRDPSEIRRSAQLRLDASRPDALLEGFQRWQAAGFSELVAYVGGASPERDAEAVADALQPLLASRAV